MHSRILVLDDEYDCDYICEQMESYGNGVDYVQESPSTFESDFEWFMNNAKDWGFEKISENEFKIVNEDALWFEMENEIKKCLEDGVKENHWRIEDRVTMKHGFWIYVNGELHTLPYFMESLKYQKSNSFKIKTFLDYHF